MKLESQKSIKFKVTPSYSNAAVVVFLVIDIQTPLLASSTYVGISLLCAVTEHIILYLFVLTFIILSSNAVSFNL